MPDRQADQALSALLPFYLNQTLPPAEQQRVEAALAASPALRAELDEQRRLMALVKQGGAAWADRLTAAQPRQELPAPAELSASTPVAARSALAFLAPANWNPAVTLALALLVAAQAGGLLWQHGTIGQLREENYQLASGKDPVVAKGAILLELKPGAAWSDVTALLDSEGLTIVGSADFGTLLLGSDKQGSALQQQIVRLRKSPLVAAADPSA